MGLIRQVCQCAYEDGTLCGNQIITPMGRENSRILILRDRPSYDEVRSGRGWTDRITSMVQEELRRVGIDMTHCYNYYYTAHLNPPKAYVDEHNTYDQRMLLSLLATHKFTAMLIVGSNNVKSITGKGSQELAGINIMNPDYEIATILANSNVEIAVPTTSASAVLNQTLGEFRLAVEKFSDMYKEMIND